MHRNTNYAPTHSHQEQVRTVFFLFLYFYKINSKHLNAIKAAVSDENAKIKALLVQVIVVQVPKKRMRSLANKLCLLQQFYEVFLSPCYIILFIKLCVSQSGDPHPILACEQLGLLKMPLSNTIMIKSLLTS